MTENAVRRVVVLGAPVDSWSPRRSAKPAT